VVFDAAKFDSSAHDGVQRVGWLAGAVDKTAAPDVEKTAAISKV